MTPSPFTHLQTDRYAGPRPQKNSTKGSWKWSTSAVFENVVEYIDGFDTKAEALAAGQAWLDEKVAEYNAAHAEEPAPVAPTHVVVDTQDGYTYSADVKGPFTLETATAFADFRNSVSRASTYRVFALTAVDTPRRCTCGANEHRGCFCGLSLSEFLAAHPDRTA